MALEDFFTLTEMKAGLTSPGRVEELIDLMQKEKDSDVKNVGERQWYTVARTIAFTDNTECLDRFVQLDGLCYFNIWLNDIQKNASDIPDSSAEESLVVLLQALEKMDINYEKLKSSGVGNTLKSLIDHGSVVKDRALLLLDSWKQPIVTSRVYVDVRRNMSNDDCTLASIKLNESSSIVTSHMEVNEEENKCTSIGNNSGGPDSLIAEKGKDVQNKERGNEFGAVVNLDLEALKDGTLNSLHSAELCIVGEKNYIIGSIGADANSEFSCAGNQDHSVSNREIGSGSIKHTVEPLANAEDSKNAVIATSVEHLKDDKSPSTSNLLETECRSLRSNDAKTEEPATEPAQQNPKMVGSEGMDISGPVCSYSQEKIQDGPTEIEQHTNCLPQEASSSKEFSSRVALLGCSSTVIVKADDVLNGIEPSHVNAVIIQEAETNTRGVLGFDLNDEILPEDVDVVAVPSQELNCDKIDHPLINHTSMATSVISASRASAVLGLPSGFLEFDGALGWKGSATTSASRLASPCKPLESDNGTLSIGPISNLKRRQFVHDFDLNMVDDEDYGNAENNLDSVIAVSSSHPSEESCVEIGPRKSKKAELDLNSSGDAPPAYWSQNGPPFSQHNAYRRSPSPASSTSSVHPSMWDVDLNKNLSMPNFSYDPRQNIVDGHRVRNPAASGISIMGTALDVRMEETSLKSPLHPNANVNAFRIFLPPSIDLSPPLQSFMFRPMVDSRGSPVLPHMMDPAQPPYFMNMMGTPLPLSPFPNGVGPSAYSSFVDLNMPYMNNDAVNSDGPHTRQYLMSSQWSRDEPHTRHHLMSNQDSRGPRQYLMSSQGGFREPQSSSVSQAFLKRKEPHTGWDPYQHRT